ncbi:MAG: CSLREA domain-containing protein [Acidobacteriota bacterium]
MKVEFHPTGFLRTRSPRAGSFVRFGAGALLVLLGSASARAATITVNTASDVSANDGKCTLREAITAANTNTASGALPGECVAGAAGLDTIVFTIPAATDAGCVSGTGVCTISPTFNLPDITEALTADASTQTGATLNTNTVASRLGLNAALKIELKGPPGSDKGLTIRAPGVLVRGFVINGFNTGIDARLTAGGTVTLEGNYVGTDVAGSAAVPNVSSGISTGGVGNIVIGGTTPGARNLISGNGRATLGPGIFTFLDIAATIQGNLIGTDASGNVAIGNGGPGINSNPVASSIIVGGTAPGAGNLVSANGYNNVSIFGGTGHVVQGNLVGTNVAGTAILLSDMPFVPGNPREGVRLGNTTNSLIGGTTAGARNVISGNVSGGVDVFTVIGSVGNNNLVQGNFIGTDVNGTADLGNSGIGILISNSPLSSVGGSAAGAANVVAFTKSISGFGGIGIAVALPGTGQSILTNSIHSNDNIGIDLGLSNGSFDGVTPNDPGDADLTQNYPVLTSAPIAAGTVTISGTLNSKPASTFRVEFFSSTVCDATGFGEGQTFLGFTTVTTNGSGDASFGPLPFAVPPGQPIITSTATSAAGNTSEFSAAQPGGCSGLPAFTPTPTPTGTIPATATRTPTAIGGVTPTVTPQGPGGVVVPTLSPFLLALFAAALALSAILLVRRNG